MIVVFEKDSLTEFSNFLALSKLLIAIYLEISHKGIFSPA